MKRYIKLFLTVFRNCFLRELEFRVNLIIWTLMDFVYLAIVLVGVELIFGQFYSIAGWDKNEVMLLIFTNSLFNDLMWTFYVQSLNFFSSQVRQGKLDMVLTKPASARFLVSVHAFEFDHYIRLLALSYLLYRQAGHLSLQPGFIGWLGYIVLIILGQIIIYNFLFLITTLNFWFTNIFNFDAVYESVNEIAHYPADIFKNKSRLIFHYLIPAVFVSYDPVCWLTCRIGGVVFVYAAIGLLLSSIVSQWFWHFSLKRYSSASS